MLAAKNTAALGKLAGEVLDTLTGDKEFIVRCTFARTDSWREGFIDGFLDYADARRSE